MSVAINTRQLTGEQVHSLETQVRLARCPILPIDEIVAHKRHLVETSRSGIWKSRYLAWITISHARITNYLYYHWGLAIVYFILAFGGGAYLGWNVGLATGIFVAPLVLALVVGVVVSVLADLILRSYSILERYEWADAYTRSGRYWMTIPFSWFDDDHFVSFFSMPDEIRAGANRLRRALHGTGADIHVEVFGRDPLIAVTRGSETVYFGAWNTDTNLDNFGAPPQYLKAKAF